MKEGNLGNPKHLSELVRLLRPDITDTDALVLFEIKPDEEASRGEGREQAGRYLTALNEAVDPDKQLKGGSGFEGSLFLEFGNGGSLWQLSWRTPEPGVTLYRWSYRRKKHHASWKERTAQKAEAGRAGLRGGHDKGKRPEDFQGQVYLPGDCH